MYILEWVRGDDLASLLTAVAVLWGAVTVPRSIYDKKRARALRNAMGSIFRTYMASEEGIVWANYADNRDQIVKAVAQRTGVEDSVVREILDEMNDKGQLPT